MLDKASFNRDTWNECKDCPKLLKMFLEQNVQGFCVSDVFYNQDCFEMIDWNFSMATLNVHREDLNSSSYYIQSGDFGTFWQTKTSVVAKNNLQNKFSQISRLRISEKWSCGKRTAAIYRSKLSLTLHWKYPISSSSSVQNKNQRA